MSPGSHSSVPQFSRTLLHLLSFGLAGALILSLFALAAISFFGGDKQAVTGTQTGHETAGTDPASYPDTPALSGGTEPAKSEANSPKADAAQLAPALPGGSSASAPASAKTEIERAPEPQPPDHDGPATTAEIRPASAGGDQSTDVTIPLEIGQPTAQPIRSADEPSPSLEPSQATAANTTAVIPDKDRDEMFHSFEMRQQKIISTGATANPQYRKKSAMQDEGSGRPDNPALSRKAAFRSRVKRECGPIKDPALYHHCVASFGTHYR
jgi:hypothetical protein